MEIFFENTHKRLMDYASLIAGGLILKTFP